MLIKSLSITNLRSHHQTDLNGFEKVVMFVGQNYSGKSTLLDALCYAFRGVCRGTDEAGRNADRLVSADGHGRQLAKTFTVKVETDIGVIERTGPGDGPRSAVQTAVDGLLGRVSQRLADPRLLIQSTWFFELTPNEQKIVIQRLTAAEVRREDVAAVVGQDFALIEHLWPAELQTRPLQDLDGIEAHVRDQRRLAKKEADFLRPVDLAVYSEEIRKLTAADAQALEVKIRTKLDALKEQLDAQVSPAVEQNKLGALKARVETLKMQAAVEIANPRDLDKEISETEGEIKKREEALPTALLSTVGIAEAKAKMEQLRTATGKCWVCDRLLDEKHKAKIRTKLEKQLADGDKAQAQVATAEREIKKLRAWVEDRRQAKADLAVAIKARQDAADELVRTLTALEQQQELVGKLIGASVEGGLAERIKTGDERLIQVRTYLQTRRLYERQVTQIADVTKRVEVLERLCEALGPKGKVRTGIAAVGGVDFAAAVNEAAEPLGLNVTIEAEPFRILARGRDASLLSTSQQLRLGFAMQVAIARITGLGFVCVDNLDWIDQAGRRTIGKAVRSIPEQVFLCATLAMPDQDYKAPTLPGWGFYLVSGDGDSSRVSRVG